MLYFGVVVRKPIRGQKVGIKTISLFCVIMLQTESLETAASVSWRRVWLLTDELVHM